MTRQSVPILPDGRRLPSLSEGRELVRVRGVVEMMTGVSRSHAKLALRRGSVLRDRLDGETISLRPNSARAPFWRSAIPVSWWTGGAGMELAAREPVLLAEFLSASSYALDFGAKASEYTAIPPLLHHLVLRQDEPRLALGLYGRRLPGPEMHVGADAVLPLSGFELTLGLAEIHRGIA